MDLRGPQCTLLVYIDDPTSRLMHLQFVESESTFDYFAATRAYLERHGKPVAFYSDKHGVFRVNKKEAASGDGMTQFGRALHALNIDIICANSSQAKGRVERAHGTLQDRLVKEMWLGGIDTIAVGNAFLEQYNRRFTKVPFDNRDGHRALSGHDDLDDAFAWKEERSVSVNLTLQYDQVVFMLEPTSHRPIARPQAGHSDRLPRWAAGHPAPRRRSALPHLRQAAAGQPGCDRREQAAGSDPGLHCRTAKGSRHVPLGQGAAPTRPEEPHVQDRIDPAIYNLKPTERRLSCSPQGDICNWRKS